VRLLRLLFFLWCAAGVLAANLRLYLKDGTYHLVREYQVVEDRVRYYSIERSEWEEVPLSLVDLKRTEAEHAQRQETLRKEAEEVAAEEKVEREQRREADRVPPETGVYLVVGDQLRPIKQAESKVVTNKGRSVLKVLTPLPVVAGKATVELDGERSANPVAGDRPEFYFRLAADERFGLIRLGAKKGARIVQKWTIIPITKELIEEQQDVEVFRKQVGEGLYKIWPVQPLEPGEYAVVEYTQAKGNVQVWDFAWRPQPGKD
jgi:hypothetical protein